MGTWVPEIGESNRRPLAMLKPSATLSAALNLLIQGEVCVLIYSLNFWSNDAGIAYINAFHCHVLGLLL